MSAFLTLLAVFAALFVVGVHATTIFCKVTYSDSGCTQYNAMYWLVNNTCAQSATGSYNRLVVGFASNSFQYSGWFPSSTQCYNTPSSTITSTLGTCFLSARFFAFSTDNIIVRTEYSDASCSTVVGSKYYPLDECTIQGVDNSRSLRFSAADANTIQFSSYRNNNCTDVVAANTHSSTSGRCMLDPSTSKHVIYTFTTPLPFSSSGGSSGGSTGSGGYRVLSSGSIVISVILFSSLSLLGSF